MAFENIECWIFFEIVIVCSGLIPFQENVKFELNEVVLFIDINNSLEDCRDVY